MWDALIPRDWNIDDEIFKYYSRFMYLDVIDSNGALPRFFVNGSSIFSSEQKN